MELTVEQMQKLDNIPTDEIVQDIKDTEREIRVLQVLQLLVKDYEDEYDILKRNPPQNKLRLYIIEGRIIKRKEFIAKLNKIISFREKLNR